MMGRLGMTDDEAIEHPLISRSIERAQKSVEGHHFDVRKRLLEYDDVMNRQREVVYSRRQARQDGRKQGHPSPAGMDAQGQPQGRPSQGPRGPGFHPTLQHEEGRRTRPFWL
jgi:hypothetical protein